MWCLMLKASIEYDNYISFCHNVNTAADDDVLYVVGL